MGLVSLVPEFGGAGAPWPLSQHRHMSSVEESVMDVSFYQGES
jgi:hypothetical protein